MPRRQTILESILADMRPQRPDAATVFYGGRHLGKPRRIRVAGRYYTVTLDYFAGTCAAEAYDKRGYKIATGHGRGETDSLADLRRRLADR